MLKTSRAEGHKTWGVLQIKTTKNGKENRVLNSLRRVRVSRLKGLRLCGFESRFSGRQRIGEYGLLRNSFLGFPCRILNINHKMDLPWSQWVEAN